MKFKKLLTIPAIALGLLATQLSPAKANISGNDVNYDWMVGSFMTKANSPNTNECTSGPWFKARAGQYNGFFFLAMASHCVYLSPNSVLPHSTYAKYYKRVLTHPNDKWYDDNNGTVIRPTGPYANWDIVMIGPFTKWPASDRVLDYCTSNNPVCTGAGSGGSSAPLIANTPQRLQGWWPLSSDPNNVWYGLGEDNVCISGIRAGTNCGLIYDKSTVSYSVNGSFPYTTPAWKLDLDEARCGVRGGDSSAAVWIPSTVTGWPDGSANVGGVLLAGANFVQDTETRCYAGSHVTVSFDVAFIGMDDIRAAFSTMDLRPAITSDNINECVC